MKMIGREIMFSIRTISGYVNPIIFSRMKRQVKALLAKKILFYGGTSPVGADVGLVVKSGAL